MVIDATSISYVCPFCDMEFISLEYCQSHVTEANDEDHYGYNGYTMDRVIELVQRSKPMEFEDKILEVADDLDDPSCEDAREIAKQYDISHYEVYRIWTDAGVSIKHMPSTSPISWDNLDDTRAELLAYHYQNDHETILHKEDKFGVHNTTLNNLIRFNGFLLKDKYRPQWVDEYEYDESSSVSTETTEDDADDIDYSIMHSDDGSYEQWVNMVRAFESSGVEYSISVETDDSEFDVLKKLINNGNEDLAEELYD